MLASALRAAIAAIALALPAHALTAHNGMVAAEHQLASQAGVEILKSGGNAVDAAVATALAVCVVNPTSCGIGGGGFMLIYDHATHRVAALDYRETAPAAASRDMFVRDGKAVAELSLHSGLAVATPGEVAGLFTALRRYGTKSFAELAAPAIALAREGFAVEPHLADSIARNADLIRARPALAAILFHPDGTPLAVGDTLRQPRLAATLELIAGRGPRAFYEGATATAIADAVQAAGGVLTTRDLAAYRPVWRQPVSAPFDGYTFFGMPPPSSGGGVMIETLNIMRRDDLRALEHNSATYLHLLAEALQFAFADRAQFYGDPDQVRVPMATLTSPARAREQRARISAPTTFSPQWYGTRAVPDDHGTSHLSVVDGAGNAVACTTSINTAFGSMVVAGDTGIILNDTMDDFSAQPGAPNAFHLVGSDANAIAPGKRPLSSMSPTIVTRAGGVAAVAGGSGGPLIITGTLQSLLNAIVFGQDALQAVSAARIHHQWAPPVLLAEPGIDGGTRGVLTGLGYKVVDAPGGASVQLVLRAPDGTLDGASDPRKGGKAAGW